MMSRRFVSLTLALTVVAAGLPALSRAEAAPSPLRSSIDRALAQPAAGGPRAAAPSPVRRNQSGGSTVGGGGGGGRMILALIGTAVSVGATIYMVKQIKKSEDPTPAPFR
jgi:hypothetical protein